MQLQRSPQKANISPSDSLTALAWRNTLPFHFGTGMEKTFEWEAVLMPQLDVLPFLRAISD